MANYTSRMMIPIGLVGRQTGTPAADVTIWALRNTSATKVWHIARIILRASFDGTAAATHAIYRLVRFAGATPSAGTAITGIQKDTGVALPTDYDAREAVAGITTTNLTFDTGFAVLGCQRQVSANAGLTLDFTRDEERPLVLLPGQGLCIRLGAAGVIGDYICGLVEIDQVG